MPLTKNNITLNGSFSKVGGITMPFQKGNKLSKGRPKGSKNRKAINDALAKDAMDALKEAVANGEQWAIQEVIKRVCPTLKPITPDERLADEFLKLYMKELVSIARRITALESGNGKSMSDKES